MVDMIPVVSSNLVAVGYDELSRELYIQFKSGTYVYYDVPSSIYHDLMSAHSLGGYHAAHIRNRYRYVRIG